jgi:hypothetical protein
LILSFSSRLYGEDIGYLRGELEEASKHYDAITPDDPERTGNS